MPSHLLIVFAKAPIPGRVKTRIAAHTSTAFATELHAAFVADLLARLRGDLSLGEVELHTDTPWDDWQSFAVPMMLQHPGDLGQRMFHALQNALARGYSSATILGSDIPAVPIAHLHALRDTFSDVSLGPTPDGGYYAICARRLHPDMFRSVRWSSPHALADTINACNDAGLSTSLGPPFFDVDELTDLPSLDPYLQELPRTAALLNSTSRSGMLASAPSFTVEP